MKKENTIKLFSNKEIDQMVYEIYGLTEEDIKIVEGAESEVKYGE